jgi:hypothetical protein
MTHRFPSHALLPRSECLFMQQDYIFPFLSLGLTYLLDIAKAAPQLSTVVFIVHGRADTQPHEDLVISRLSSASYLYFVPLSTVYLAAIHAFRPICKPI